MTGLLSVVSGSQAALWLCLKRKKGKPETCDINIPRFSSTYSAGLPVRLGKAMEVENHSLSSLSLPRLPDTNKRRLLLVYIHGFMGSEASFHDLPVHVHDLLTDILSQSHVVYTRIYPRYKSHGEIQTAVTQFSDW